MSRTIQHATYQTQEAPYKSQEVRAMKKPKQKFTPQEIRDACEELYNAAGKHMTPKDAEKLRARWEEACIECVLESATRMAEAMPNEA
jgi:hypothetical protein